MTRLVKAAAFSAVLALAILGSQAQVRIVRGWALGLFGDGSAAAPSIAFASEPNTGFFHNGASSMVFTAGGSTRSQFNGDAFDLLGNTPILRFGSGQDVVLGRGAAGQLNISNAGSAIGSRIKVDALPTAGTCGTSPAVTAGSTPFAGSVNVGTGGTATSCTVTFNGTAFPAAPFCTLGQSAGTFTTYTATTTVLTLSAATAWPASTVVSWVCPSSK